MQVDFFQYNKQEKTLNEILAFYWKKVHAV